MPHITEILLKVALHTLNQTKPNLNVSRQINYLYKNTQFITDNNIQSYFSIVNGYLGEIVFQLVTQL